MTRTGSEDAAQPAANPTDAPAAAGDGAPGENTAPATPPSAATDSLAAARKEAAENYDRYVRAVADLDNFRRRAVREKDELRQYAASRLLEDLLPVVDNLALGLAAAGQPNADLKTLVGGVDLVLQQLKTVLAGHGVKEISPGGQTFDPHLHEAISHVPSPDIGEGRVVTVVRPGFTLNGRLLRPAAVVVSSGAKPDGAARS